MQGSLWLQGRECASCANLDACAIRFRKISDFTLHKPVVSYARVRFDDTVSAKPRARNFGRHTWLPLFEYV